MRDPPTRPADSPSHRGHPAETSAHLSGLAIVVTRPEAQAQELIARLEAEGAEVEHFPAVEIRPPADRGPLRDAAEVLDSFDWVVLSSANAVRALASEGQTLASGGSPRRVAVVGEATADAVRSAGWAIDLVATPQEATGLLAAFDHERVRLEDAHVLLAVGDRARDVLESGLRKRGARVKRVVAYRTVQADQRDAVGLSSRLQGGRFDLLTFTSPSTAESFLEIVGPTALDVPVAVIGPVTRAAVEELGYHVVAVADTPSASGLVDAIAGTAEELRRGKTPAHEGRRS